ncbi:hypothetical protein BYT27DRAFT_7211606 [Phlegmacium glaucopus]|nr:hypothetical protein BYT27DRAFT_7211606 [Phlegmacium glaucopus]
MSSIQQQICETVANTLQKGEEIHSCVAMSGEVDDTGNHRTGGPMVEASELGDGNQLQRSIEALCENSFMKTPLKQVVDATIMEFIDQTSNAALAIGVCAVCARETAAMELTPLCLESIPNSHRLTPVDGHPHHEMFNGMLLHPAGVADYGRGDVCVECLRALKSDKVPTFALVNGLWIGPVPHELAYLTLPERILIAKYFPAAYIIKLFAKKKGAHCWDKRQMYSRLRGNAQITSMIDGTVMPQVVKVLAATIGITFVGPKNIPEKCLPDMFRVRRTCVKNMLEWLKENNPLFKNIMILASRLSQLPEDDVPYELMVTAKHSMDMNMLYSEQEGYVPAQDASNKEDEGGCQLLIEAPILIEVGVDVDIELSEDDGVVDIDGTDVLESELMAHALANCCQDKEMMEDQAMRTICWGHSLLFFPLGKAGLK